MLDARQDEIRLVARLERRKKMNRLRRFYEKLPDGGKSSRVAYVISVAALPESLPDAEWTEDPTFRAGEAVLADPGLKTVYKVAIEDGLPCNDHHPRQCPLTRSSGPSLLPVERPRCAGLKVKR